VTDWDGFQARVHPGAGIVARTAGGALVIPAPAGQEQTVNQLLGLIRDASPGGGRALARKLAGVLATAEGDETLDLVLLAPLGGGDLAVLVVGDIEVSAETAEGAITVSGRDSLTWVDRVLRQPTQVNIFGGAGAADAFDASDLVAGIVPGSGLSLLARGATLSAPVAAPEVPVVAPPAPEVPVVVPPPPPVPEFQVESLTDDAEPAREPLPVDVVEEPLPVGSEQAQVKGVFCKRGHFNDPMVQFCTVCGINMVQQTPALVDGPRPPLGVLVFDDGSVYQLEQDYVLGRQPEGAPEVVSGAARPLRLEDSGGTVSRAHALISLEGWTVRLSDHGSANGTYIAMPNSPDWQPVPPNGRVVLAPGTTIKLGNRTVKYESHRGQR
jgi:FHA domain